MAFIFGNCLFDPVRRRLLRHGIVIPTEPLVLDVLAYLIQHRDRVVAKGELIEHVWKRRAVSDAAITSRISLLRRALGDRKSSPSIQTYNRHGYRFVAAVTSDDSTTPPDAKVWRAHSAPISAGRTTITTCRFETCDGRTSSGNVELAFRNDLTTALTRFRSLSILSPLAELNDAHLAPQARFRIEGSIRNAGQSWRITVRLVENATSAIVWSDACTIRPFRNSASIDDIRDVASTVAGTIATRLEGYEVAEAQVDIGVHGAKRNFLLGMGQLYRWNREGLENATRLFKQAISLQPDFAPPYAMAAYCYVQQQSNGWIADQEAARRDCGKLATIAIELADGDALVVARAAHALSAVANNQDDAAELVEEALKLNPSLGAAWYVSGWVHLFGGRLGIAADHLTRAARLQDAGVWNHKTQTALAYVHFFNHRYEEGAAIADRVLRRCPRYQTALRVSAANHSRAGNRIIALQRIEQSLALDRSQSIARVPGVISFQQGDHMATWVDALHDAGLPC